LIESLLSALFFEGQEYIMKNMLIE